METYNNSYKKNEDQMMWELHEIRHKLHKDRKNKSIEEINRVALQNYAEWQKETDAKTKR
jgi:antitoxin component HigA of HigAB toxin-antitoxin module